MRTRLQVKTAGSSYVYYITSEREMGMWFRNSVFPSFPLLIPALNRPYEGTIMLMTTEIHSYNYARASDQVSKQLFKQK